MKTIRIAAILVGAYVALGLALDGAIGYFQPQQETTAVLRTFDENGRPHDKREAELAQKTRRRGERSEA